MLRRILLGVTIALAVGTSVAWAQKVKTDFDPSADFSSYRTYYWAKAAPIPGNDLMNQRVVAAVDQWLTSKGWTKVPEGQGDIAVAVNISTKESQSLNTFYDGMGGWGYRGWGGGMGSATTTVSTYVDGTMLVDLFDAKTKKLVWRGIGTDTVSDDPKKNAEKIQRAVEKMFKKKFPPGVSTN